MDLSNYIIALFGSHNVMIAVKRHVNALIKNKIRYKEFIIADGGFFPSERRWIESKIDVRFIKLLHRNFGEIEGQSKEYRKLISQRPAFIKKIFELGSPVISVDSDTVILSNNFDALSRNSDLTINVRKTNSGDHAFKIEEDNYHWCGVMFYHNPLKCISMLDDWIEVMKEADGKPTAQFEQGNFWLVRHREPYKELKVQELHCEHFGCYEKKWLCGKTVITAHAGTDKTKGFQHYREK